MFALPGPKPLQEPAECYAWIDNPFGPETEERSTLSKLCSRALHAVFRLSTIAHTVRDEYLRAMNELRRIAALLTMQNAAALPWLLIKGSAYAMYAACSAIVFVPGCLAVGTVTVVLLTTYLVVLYLRETIDSLTFSISRRWRALYRLPKLNGGKQQANSD